MRLNPFRSLPNPRQVWAWGMYDLANQSFTLLILTLFFGVFFTKTVVGGVPPGTSAEQIANDPIAAAAVARGNVLWGRAIAISSLIVVVLSPFLGALADFTGRKKAMLIWLGLLCAVITVLLAITGPGAVVLAMSLFILANVGFMLGENFLASFLPELSTRETIGRISAIGWTMGYIGALICLPMALLIPGLREQSVEGYRWLFAFAGIWFFINIVPAMALLAERKKPEPLPPGASLWTIGFARVIDSALHVGRYRQLAVFLTFFCIYCCGMQVIIAFAGIIAQQYLPVPQLILFAFVLAGVSAIGSTLSGMFQDRIGQRLTVQISLVIWVLTCIGAALMPAVNPARWVLWCVGVGVGLGLGLTGAASRALVGVLTPAHKAAEFFGLWGMGYKIANVIGPPLYGVIFAWKGQQWALGFVGLFFVVGLIGTFFVDVMRGRAAAEDAEREFASQTDIRDIAAAAQISAKELEHVKRTSETDAGRAS